MLKEMSPIRRWLWRAWGVTLALVIVGSLLPGAWMARIQTDVAPVSDKLLHFVGYCLLAALPALASRRTTGIVGCVVAVVMLGAMLEVFQRFVPGRAVELADLGANNLGVLTGASLGWVLRGIVRL